MSQELKYRIFNAMPAGTYQMDRLLQLVDIVECDSVPTACVECKTRPRMKINPDFVAQHCRIDEHLFLLVMHEIYHVILGHTRLFEHPSRIHNIIFDAIINSMLCRDFRDPEYVSFFQRLNSWESFPSCLLRPPPGWPGQWDGQFPAGATPEQKKAIGLLYGEASNEATYHDIWEALLSECVTTEITEAGEAVAADDSDSEEKSGTNAEGDGDGGERDEADQDTRQPVLLGNHGEMPDDADDLEANQTLRDVLRDIIEKWPPPKKPIAGRDMGRRPQDFLLDASQKPRSHFMKALKKLLEKSGFYNSGRNRSRHRTIEPTSTEILTPLPQARDRRALAHRRLHGRSPLFYQGLAEHRRPVLNPRSVAHVYLDVSGSMLAEAKIICAALKSFHQRGEVRVHVFSTVVDTANPNIPLDQQPLKNTFGTDIQCVIDHVLDIPPKKTPQRVLVFTDGYTGKPSTRSWKEFQKRKTRLYAGILEEGDNSQLGSYCTHCEYLPALA